VWRPAYDSLRVERVVRESDDVFSLVVKGRRLDRLAVMGGSISNGASWKWSVAARTPLPALRRGGAAHLPATTERRDADSNAPARVSTRTRIAIHGRFWHVHQTSCGLRIRGSSGDELLLGTGARDIHQDRRRGGTVGRGRAGAGAPRGLWRLRPPARNAPGRRSTHTLDVRTVPADGLRPAGQSSASSPRPPWWQHRRCHRRDLAFPALRPIPALRLRRLARTPRS
jgi:hypothetical protein